MKTLIFVLLCFSASAQKLIYHSLEASYIGLNVYDLKTTFDVIDKGGYEMNPIMKGTHAHMIAVKSFATLGTLGLLRIIRKDHPKTAMISLIVANVGMGYLVTRNYQISIRIPILPTHPTSP
jgi:uncharacterized membrane protein